jgi:hypothetical protein
VLALVACAFVLLEPAEGSARQDYCASFNFTSGCFPVYPGGLCNPDVMSYCQTFLTTFPFPWNAYCVVDFGSNCMNGWGSGCMDEDYRYECKYKAGY